MKIDLKHAYFHLSLEPGLKDVLNFQIGSQVFQCCSACFGLYYLPFLWTQVMKPFMRRWRALCIVCFIYPDDILIFGLSKAYLNKMKPVVLKDLQDAGLAINFTNSLSEPAQPLEALGLELDMLERLLLVPYHKLKGYRREAVKKVPTRTGPCCAPSACNPCRFAPDQRLHLSKSRVPNPKI